MMQKINQLHVGNIGMGFPELLWQQHETSCVEKDLLSCLVKETHLQH